MSDQHQGTPPTADEQRRAAGSTIAQDVQRLVGRDHPEPHAVLGAHPAETGKGLVVRVFRPEAASVSVRVDGAAKAVGAEPIEDTGVFEAVLPDAAFPVSYELEVAYPGGQSFGLRDPYAFAPTLGELDLHLAGEGRHEDIYERMGAHVRTVDGVEGVAFTVWAPSARSVSVVGDFNGWDGRLNPMRTLGSSGIWELFVPGVPDGSSYKFELRTQAGELALKADPYAFATEIPPETNSVIHRPGHEWRDQEWITTRSQLQPLRAPVSIYEVHLGSWRRDPADPERWLSYAELGEQLAAYCVDMGFTHVELLPVMGHPFDGSWGYQVTSYFAPSPRHGSPDDFDAMVDALHQAGIGVVLDWVPAHFPKDSWALAHFDGTALYEHADPRRGEHPDWGTLVFNSSRNEVRNFLLASALYWCRAHHADGIRVDAVASMLYLDYSREAGEWIPNEFGGREDLDNVALLKQMNEVLHAREPGVISAAEESTAWPGVSRPTYLGGLGFGFKWNMGWMHDTLGYFQQDPIHRRFHHGELTFSLMYAFSENFILPLSHDEVVHGKGSLIDKMPGDRWQKMANLRCLYAYQWAHPGKQLLFMGQEIAQWDEWNHERSLDWHLLGEADHAGVQQLVRDLNQVYRATPALWEIDNDPSGFRWIEANDAEQNVVVFSRVGEHPGQDVLVCAMNLSPVVREGYRMGLPKAGRWREALNTDAQMYGGSGVGNLGGVEAEPVAWMNQPHSAVVTLPPLGVLWFVPERG